MHTANGYVEVTKGLAAGEQLVVLGGEPLSDGVTVKISQRTTMEAFDAGAPANPAPSASGAPGVVQARVLDAGSAP
jgi:hypothetical protein